MNKFDLIAIGDITTDAFIRLSHAEVTCEIDKENCQICMNFGDKIPYESATIIPAVGNSPNASVSASRLGLKTAILTNIGNDEQGKEAVIALEKNKVDTSLIKIHDDKNTNYHYVLWYGDERTILIKHEEFEYQLPELNTNWIYLSSLGENSIKFHHQIADYIKKTGIKLAFQPGTFQIKLGYEELKDIYEVSEVFFCNIEEAQRITGKETRDIKILMETIHQYGPKIVVLTDGPQGAYAYDGNKSWFMPIYPDPKPPLERTGAGDSFSSTFTACLALGKTIEEALTLSPINSMNVVQHIGAQAGLLTQEELKSWLDKAPKEYVIKEI